VRPAVTHLSGQRKTGAAHALMFRESQILVGVLLRLIKTNVVALPMHDGIMVAETDEPIARQAMADVSEAFTGYILPVVRKDITT